MVYGMSRKPKTVSVTSIAAELGISPSAVSRAINNRAGVSETVRTRVAGLLEKYAPSEPHGEEKEGFF